MRTLSRSGRLAAAMKQANLSALLVTHLPGVRWLSGFTGSNGLVAAIAGKSGLRMRFFTDGRYTQQAKQEVRSMPVTVPKRAITTEAVAWLEKNKVTRCGFDSSSVTVAALDAMRKAVTSGKRRSFFQAAPGLVSTLREIKDAAEIDALRKAAHLGCYLYEDLLGWLEPGMTEAAVAAELEHRARLAGAEAMSFETIVASGLRGGLPHGRASDKRLARGEMVTFDFGVILDGYCSDMTRTVYLGPGKRVSSRQAEQRRVFDAVLEAQMAAVDAVRPGATCEEVDEAARQILRAAGLEKEFSHSTGHGVGLEIHEGPRIGAKVKQKLEPGMVVTIEPGAYLAGKFGVRIEDTVLVTARGAEILTPSPKAWTEL